MGKLTQKVREDHGQTRGGCLSSRAWFRVACPFHVRARVMEPYFVDVSFRTSIRGHGSLGPASRAACARRGAISLSIASHFAALPVSYIIRPVRLPPGRAGLCSKTRSDRIGDAEKNDRDCGGLALQRSRDRGRHCEDDLGLQRDQFRRKRLVSTRSRSRKAILDTPATHRSVVCARQAAACAATGHAAAAPPSSVMNSRRLIQSLVGASE
jgi:hypothetical protein